MPLGLGLSIGIGSQQPSGTAAGAPSLLDNFNDNSRNTSLWNIGALKTTGLNGTVSETSQRLEILPAGSSGYTGYITANTYDLSSSSVYVKMTLAGTMDAVEESYLGIGIDGSNYYLALVTSSNVLFQKNIAGSPSNVAAVAYNATNHVWFRIRASGGTIFLDAAPSTASNPPISGDWVNIGSETAGIALTAVKVALVAGVSGAAAPTTIIFDGFNTAT